MNWKSLLIGFVIGLILIGCILLAAIVIPALGAGPGRDQYLPIVIRSGPTARPTPTPTATSTPTPEKPMFNENMVSLIFDVGLDNAEYEVWEYLDPSPEIRDVNNFTYTAPENYLILSAVFYSYGDGIYWWFRHPDKNVQHCMNAFTYTEGGPNIRLDGKWCFTEFQTRPDGYDAYEMYSTSPIPFDVAVFKMKQIGGK